MNSSEHIRIQHIAKSKESSIGRTSLLKLQLPGQAQNDLFSSISSILKSDLKGHFLVSHQAFHTWMPVPLSMALLLPVTRTPPPNIANKPLEKTQGQMKLVYAHTGRKGCPSDHRTLSRGR